MWNNDAVIVLVEGNVLIALGWRGVGTLLTRMLNLRTFIAPNSCFTTLFFSWIFGQSMASPKQIYTEGEGEESDWERESDVEQVSRKEEQPVSPSQFQLTPDVISAVGQQITFILICKKKPCKEMLNLHYFVWIFFLKAQCVIFCCMHHFCISKSLIYSS